MANPNIVSVTTINGNTQVSSVTTATANIIINAVSSGKILKVNTLFLSNIATSGNVALANVEIFRSGTAYKIAQNVEVASRASLDVFSKSLYLLEGDTLRVQADTNSALQAVVSFEEIS